MSTTTPARVVVADDSAMMRAIVTNSLKASGVEVVGSASNGDEALALCERERPDAMTLDLAMPGLDGIGVLRELRTRGDRGVPVVVVSAFSPAHGARAVDALAEGAFDLVAKPAIGEGLELFKQSLAEKINAAVQSRRGRTRFAAPDTRVAPRVARSAIATATPLSRSRSGGFTTARRPTRTGVHKVVLIATSTGGPRALASLLPKLPAPLGMGTMIVQHMPPGFTGSLAARLNSSSPLNVREATSGEPLDAGTALIAPGGLHLRLRSDGRTSLSEEAAIGGLRPRADLLIEDAAKLYGDRLLLVVMTGMGNDGLRGANEVRRRGGRILVESQDTCTVYGMPRAIVEAQLADEVLPLDQLAAAIAAEAA
jgi:two-component system, chemotaxis family, protein-glutamate methylesterase/glutaminase